MVGKSLCRGESYLYTTLKFGEWIDQPVVIVSKFGISFVTCQICQLCGTSRVTGLWKAGQLVTKTSYHLKYDTTLPTIVSLMSCGLGCFVDL